MISYKGLDDLALRVLANLNEAGEECVCTLLNTVLRKTGKESHRDKYLSVLRSLFDRGLIEFSDRRSATTLESIVLPREETLSRLALLSSQLQWDDESAHWTWTADEPRLEVLATDRGWKLSNDILEKFGWQMTEPI